MSKDGARKGPRGTTKSEVYLRNSLLFLSGSRALVLLRGGASEGSVIKWIRGKIQIKGQDIFKAVGEIYNKIEPVGPHSDDEWQSLRVMLTRCEIARFFHMDRTFWSSET